MKKWIVLLTAAITLSALSGCGCGKVKNDTAEVISQNKDYVYSFESFNEKLEGHDLSQNYITQDRMVFVEYRYEEVMPEAGGEFGAMEEAGEEGLPVIEEEMPEEEYAEEDAAAVEEEIITEDAEKIVVEEAVAIDDMSVDMPVEDFYEEYIAPKSFICILQCDHEGNILSEFEIEQPSDSGIHGISVDDNGNIYLVQCEYGKDTSNPEMVQDLYTLLAYSENGEEFYRISLGEDAAEDEYYYVNQIICDKEGRLILWTTSGIEIYNQDLTFEKTVKLDNQDAGMLCLLRDGSLVVQCYGDRNQYFKKLDLNTGELSERIDVPYDAYNYSHYPGLTSDFILVDSIGVYTYNLGEEAAQKIMDFVDSDMTSSTCYSITQLTDKSFFAWTYDELSGMDMCGIFTKVEPSDIPDKKVLTLGTQWLDTDVRARVVEFNKNSTEYRIRVEDYNQYNTPEDYTIGATKLNTDIASGNAPDILCLTGDMPIDSYMSKGLFADLKTFVEKDPELAVEDYMPEVMEAFSRDGKWYQLVPSYYLFTVLGKTADVGEEPGWTFEQLQALREEKGEDVLVISERTKTSILDYSMMLNSDQFIDWESGECYFNTQAFIDLLEFANEFPDEIDYDALYNDQTYWESQETMFREGRALLMPYTLANFEDFVYCEQGTFGEQITAVGFPVSEGVGNAYSSNLSFAISAKSEYQDVAWEFLRYYLTDEYQDELFYGWPVKLSSLNKRMEAAQKRPSYVDEFGNTVEYDDTYYLNGMEIVLEPLTPEDCDRVLSFLKSADHVYSYDSNIMTILQEECAAYFEGQKSAQEVADIIQSRVHIYVNENL